MAPGILTKVSPASVLTCHWTCGVGLPAAVEVKDTALPVQTALLTGSAVTVVGVFTVTTAVPELEPVQLPPETELTA